VKMSLVMIDVLLGLEGKGLVQSPAHPGGLTDRYISLEAGQCNGEGTRVCTKPFPSKPNKTFSIIRN